MWRTVLFAALMIGVQGTPSPTPVPRLDNIARIEFEFRVLGMSIDNFGQDFVKSFTLNYRTPNFDLGVLPHGTTQITANAYDSVTGGNLIYQTAPFEEDFDTASSSAVLTLLAAGYEDVTSDHNLCPIVISWDISPMNLRPGRDTTISYRTFDSDGASGTPVQVELDMPVHQNGVTDGIVSRSDYGALDDPQDVTVETDHRYGYGSRIINLDSDELDSASNLIPRQTSVSVAANDTQGCSVTETINTKIIPAVTELSVDVQYGNALVSVTADDSTTAGLTATNSGDDVQANLVFQDVCSGAEKVQTLVSCVLTGESADGSTVTHTQENNCAEGQGTTANPLEIQLPFVTGTLNGAVCTATHTILIGSTSLPQTNTFTYFSGVYTVTETHEPEVDFVFVSRQKIMNGNKLTLLVDFRGFNTITDPAWVCEGKMDGASEVYEEVSTLVEKTGTFSNQLKRGILEVEIKDALKFTSTSRTSKCTVSVSDGSKSAERVFEFNNSPFVYLSPYPTPAPNTASPTPGLATPAPSPCVAPDTCSTHSIGETSMSRHVYLSQSIDAHDLPPGSVIAIHTQDAHIFASGLAIDAQHAIDNCAEIEARVHSVSKDSNDYIYHIEIKELYYDNAWHNGTSLVVDASSLSQTVFRIVSKPLVSTEHVIELRDCQSNAVQVRELVLQHYGYDLQSPDTGCEDGVIYGVVDFSAVCHVGFAAHNTQPCDSVSPIALPCNTVCQEYSGVYLQAASDGTVHVYSDSACTTQTASLPVTGDLDARASTNGALPSFDAYASQKYN